VKLSRKRAEDEDEFTTIWLITYSDMVTLLLAFFLLIYSFSVLKEDEQEQLVRALREVEVAGIAPEQLEQSPEELEQIARDIAARFGDTGEDEAWVDAGEAEVTVGLPASITFQVGEAELTPRAREILAEVGANLAKTPNAIRVEGHTDNLPIRSGRFASNWHLSAARAQNVVRLFIEQGVAPERLQVVGHADTRPRASNDTPEGRRANRRIEIKLVRTRATRPESPAPTP